jgi:hypothetical protein
MLRSCEIGHRTEMSDRSRCNYRKSRRGRLVDRRPVNRPAHVGKCWDRAPGDRPSCAGPRPRRRTQGPSAKVSRLNMFGPLLGKAVEPTLQI